MARILRTTYKNGKSRYGFQWPSSGPVEAPDWDPTPVCGRGLHGLLEGRGDLSHLSWDPDALWQIVEVEEFIDLKGKVKFPKGNVIFSGDREGALSLLAGEQTVREWVLQDPQWAYDYAIYVDRGPRDDTREAVIQGGPQWAYIYALEVDKEPHDDTRAAALGDPMQAYYYARDVDCGPRDDTRAAVLKGGSEWAYKYAIWAYEYVRHVGKGG